MSVRSEERKAQWVPHIEAWQASGLSAHRFCKDNALSYSQFLYWVGKLRPTAAPSPASGFTRVVPLSDPAAPTGLHITLPSGVQVNLFDETELEAALRALDEQFEGDADVEAQDGDAQQRHRSRTRERGFCAALRRERVELLLSDADKEGALKTFLSKIKEELSYIPPQLKVSEYWQEKAVFAAAVDAGNVEDAQERIVAAPRPLHPLGKCFAHPTLLAYLITAKYADGLPLYRLEGILKREGHEVSRSVMANWIIRLEDVFRPLMNLMREEQNGGRYLQADETRIQVLKEDRKTVQSKKWMWVTCGGPPGRLSVLFAYDPSRAGAVAERLLDGFTGILQADGYSGYNTVCEQQGMRRIGCWDHARRKFVEASRAGAAGIGKGKGKVAKADVALGYIRSLYRIEREIADRSPAEKYRARQALSVPKLDELKAWLTKNQSRVLTDSLTRKGLPRFEKNVPAYPKSK